VLRLHSFGEVYISRDGGEPLTGAATQRRSLALLALLATAGDGGLSRDKLIGLLWPDSDPERARHSLTQALYTTRRALHDDELFIVTPAGVRVNPDRFGSDARDLDAALDRGQMEQASSLYTGPFLDGFFVSGAPDFERWSSAQRDRYEQRIGQALEHLASAAEHARNTTVALLWRQRLAAIAPLDSSNTIKLMTAMADGGDRAGAIRYARIHASLLREEMDLDPDPVVEALALRLRASSAGPENATADVDAAAPAATGSITEATDVDDDDTVPSYHEIRPALSSDVHMPLAVSVTPFQWRVTRRGRWTVLALLVFTLIGVGVLLGRARSSPDTSVHELAVRQNVVVAPFRVAGADPSLAYLRDGVVELLSTRLADDSAARSVDAGAVLGAWRAAGLSPAMDLPRATVVTLATRLGAKRVVVGSVVGTAARMVLTATVLALPSGAVSGQAAVAGPADSISPLLDRLAAKLLVSEAGQDEDLAHHVSRSLPALRAFLAGQAAFRQGHYPAALRSYAFALRRDSSFALAALYQALGADRLSLDTELRAGTGTAWVSRSELSERDQSRLLALSGPRFPALATRDELATAWQHMVDIAPSNADTWYELALRLLHDGRAAGIVNARQRATAALQRAIAIDSTYGAARRLLTGLVPRDSAGTMPLQSGTAGFLADSATLAEIRSSLPGRDSGQLRAVAMASQVDAASLDDGGRALELLGRRGLSRADRLDLTLAEHSLALNRGQWARAIDIATRMRRLQPGSRQWLRLRVLDGLYGDARPVSAAADARSLDEAVNRATRDIASTTEGMLSDACVLAQWHVSHGDTSQVALTIARLRAWQQPWAGAMVSASPLACADLLDAALAIALHHRDAEVRLAHLDSLVFTPQSAGDAHAYAPIIVARLHEQLGDVQGAIRALERGRPTSGWPRYLAAMSRYEGQLAERVGDTTLAQTAYRRFLAFRPADGTSPEPMEAEVRNRLRLLSGTAATR